MFCRQRWSTPDHYQTMDVTLRKLYLGLLLILEAIDSGCAQGKQSCLLYHFFL